MKKLLQFLSCKYYWNNTGLLCKKLERECFQTQLQKVLKTLMTLLVLNILNSAACLNKA